MITRDRLAQLDFETRNGGPSTLLSGELRELVKVYLTQLEAFDVARPVEVEVEKAFDVLEANGVDESWHK